MRFSIIVPCSLHCKSNVYIKCSWFNSLAFLLSSLKESRKRKWGGGGGGEKRVEGEEREREGAGQI